MTLGSGDIHDVHGFALRRLGCRAFVHRPFAHWKVFLSEQHTTYSLMRTHRQLAQSQPSHAPPSSIVDM